jgi:hypothetical protein
MCAGLIEMKVSVLIMDLNPKREGLFVSLMHVLFGTGAFVGPFLSSIKFKCYYCMPYYSVFTNFNSIFA